MVSTAGTLGDLAPPTVKIWLTSLHIPFLHILLSLPPTDISSYASEA